MKKVLCGFILSILLLMPIKVFAAGYISPSTGSISVYQGNSTTFSITAYNAVGDVVVSSSNPGVATVSPGSWATGAVDAGQTKTGTFTVTGVGVGSATITVVVDGYSFDDEDVSGTKTITVNVTQKPAPAPSTPTPSTPTPSNPSPSTPTPSGPADNRSSDTGLKKLTVNGKTLTNSNNVYTLEVGNYIEKVDIDAVVFDSKAKVSGTGSKNLKVGENKFDLVVTAEKGNTTTYTVKIVRKEYNTISDFDELMKLNKDVEIKITDKAKLSKEQIDKIIKNKKKVILTKFDSETKKILYSFVLDGNKIKSSGEFNPNISAVVEELDDMEEAFNYAAGIYLDFTNCGDIPKGIVLKYFVGDKYKDNDKVNLYSYDSTKVTQLKENILVVDGYIEFNVDDTVRHLISKAKILNAESKSDEVNIWFFVSLGLIGVIVVGGIVILLSKSKGSKETVSVEKSSQTAVVSTPVPSNTPVPVSTSVPVSSTTAPILTSVPSSTTAPVSTPVPTTTTTPVVTQSQESSVQVEENKNTEVL